MEPYEPRFPAEMQELLGNGDYMCWLLVSIRDPFDQSTVNLKSPIVVNPALHQAAQFILDADLPLRHPLFREEESKC